MKVTHNCTDSLVENALTSLSNCPFMASGSELARRVEDLRDDLEDGIEEAVDNGLDTTKEAAKANLIANNSVVHGALKSSITRADSDPRADYIVRSDLPRAKYLEYGTGVYADPEHPYKSPDPMPPYGPIRQWVIRKGLTASNTNIGVDARRNLVQDIERGGEPDQIAEQKAIAFRIQQIIGKYGNRPHPFMRPAWRAGKPRIMNQARVNVKRAVRRF
jgi:HK97 gp10 family phage protein